jgi:glucose/arabinose dehydrogenase
MRSPLLCIALIMAVGVLAGSSCSATNPLPYVTEPAFNLRFDQPLAIVSAPGDTQRLFILEKPGQIVVIPDLDRPSKKTFLDLRSRVGSDDVEQGVLALAFHPDFQRNRQFYVWYTSCLRVNGAWVREDRLSRFTVLADNPNAADPTSEQRLITQADDAPNHNGGELLFGPDGYLYLSVGDEGGANDQYRNSQHIDHDFFAGILRIDVDRRSGNLAPNPHAAVHTGTYSIPADNPFVGATEFNGRPVDAAKVRTEFWAVGLRNPWRMSFDARTGLLWCADVGQDREEEIDIITRGGNYGWNYREATQVFRGTAPAAAKFVEPIWQYSHADGLSITGGFVSRGTRYPDLDGKYLFADFVFGHVWALAPSGENSVTASSVRQIAQSEAIASFGRDPRTGDILLTSLGNGRILRLVKNPKASK